jgi:hypothetical protein
MGGEGQSKKVGLRNTGGGSSRDEWSKTLEANFYG